MRKKKSRRKHKQAAGLEMGKFVSSIVSSVISGLITAAIIKLLHW